MHSLTDEIRKYFAGLTPGKAARIDATAPYNAWAVRMPGWYGVAIDCGDISPVSLHFTNSLLRTTELEIGGTTHNVLVLSCTVEEYRNEFAAVCAQFTFPGASGEQRRDILERPTEWWDRWRSLLGNSLMDENSYSTLAELLAYEGLILSGKAPIWSGASGSTHDIETADADYEVKSTTNRYGAEITLSSQFQLQTHDRPLHLLFFRFEPAAEGDCVDSVAKRLVYLGINTEKLEKKLSAFGMEPGSYARTETYHCLETRDYPVDNRFPAITEKSFKNDRYPDSLIRFTYAVTLDSLPYSSFCKGENINDSGY